MTSETEAVAGSSRTFKSVSVLIVGFIGAVITAARDFTDEQGWVPIEFEEPFTLLIPAISMGIYVIGLWFWNIFKPQNAENARNRRQIRKSIKSIDKRLKSEDLTEEGRLELTRTKEKLFGSESLTFIET